MRNFYKFARKKICIHHDYDATKLPTNSIYNFTITTIDIVRMLCYLYVGFKVCVKLPQLLGFKAIRAGKSANNNPDFRLCESEAMYKEATNLKH